MHCQIAAVDGATYELDRAIAQRPGLGMEWRQRVSWIDRVPGQYHRELPICAQLLQLEEDQRRRDSDDVGSAHQRHERGTGHGLPV